VKPTTCDKCPSVVLARTGGKINKILVLNIMENIKMKFIIAHKKSVSDEPVKPTSLFDENYHGPILVDPESDINLRAGDTCGCCGNEGFFGYWVPSGNMTGINRVWYRNIGCEGDDPSYIKFDTKLNCWELYDDCCGGTFLSSPENINTANAKSPWDYSYTAENTNAQASVPSATTVKMYPSFNAEKMDQRLHM